MVATQSLLHFKALEERRRKLGMTYAVLAEKSGVSMATVVRILSGKHAAASFGNVNAIAQALGMDLRLGSRTRVEDLREEQARKKAKCLVGMLQGTSGLEGQGLDEEALSEMTEQTVHELLAGSNRRLWGE